MFKKAVEIVAPRDVLLAMLYATADVESDFRWSAVNANSKAYGAFQILPSTQKLLAKAYSLPSISTSNLTQAEYALAHMIEDVRAAKRLGVPDVVRTLLAGMPIEVVLPSALRFFYHNGPSLKMRPGHEADIKKAVMEYASAMNKMLVK